LFLSSISSDCSFADKTLCYEEDRNKGFSHTDAITLFGFGQPTVENRRFPRLSAKEHQTKSAAQLFITC
jgi:hypothetical protein